MLAKIEDELKRRNNFLILTHHNADVDAIASALVLKHLIEEIGKDAKIGVPESVSEAARNFLTEEVKIDPKIGKEEVIIVDTSALEQLEPIEVKNVFLVIDHHIPGNIKAEFSWIEPEAKSCSELIYRLSKEMNIKIDGRMATVLAGGLIYDTAHLRRADKETFRLLLELLEKADKDYQEILGMLHTNIDISERIAMLKSMTRMTSYRIGNVLISFTSVGSFEASVARNLLRMGADIAVVGAPKKKAIRISGRMRWNLKEKVNLAEIFSKIEKIIGGSAGGHDVAASANGKRPENMDKAFRFILKQLEEKLGEKAKELK